MPTLRYAVLDNGTEVLLAGSPASHVVALQIWVKSGSLAESPEQSGMAHFVEHMLFKGTEVHRAGDFARIVESCGGSIGAYTSYDRTVYHLTILHEYMDVGLALLYDAIYHSVFAAQEIEREKEVVCEEISKYADDPASVVSEEAMRLAWQGQVLPILGRDVETVRSYQADGLRQFYRQHYVPANIAVVAVGNFDLDAELTRISKVFGKAELAPVPSPSRSPLAYTGRSQAMVVRGDFQMPRLLVTLPAPVATDVDAISFEIAAHALGAGECSRVLRELRDELGLISSASISYLSVATWGVFDSALLAEEENICAALTALHKCLREVHEVHTDKPITAREVERFIINTKADFAQQCESVESLAALLGYGLLTEQKYLHIEHSFAMLESVTPQIISQVLQRRVCLSQAVIVCALPHQTNLREAQLLAAFSSEQSKCKPSSPPAVIPKLNQPFTELQPGFIYQQQRDAKLCNFVIVAKGGLLDESSDNNGIFNAIACMLGQATKTHAYQQLMQRIEDKGAMLAGFSGKDSIGMQMQCLAVDTEYFCQLLAECLTDPVFPEQQWRVVADEISAAIRLQTENPAAVCMRHWQEKIFAGHPYRFPLLGSSLINADASELKTFYHQHADQGGWVFAASGAETGEKMQARVNSLFSQLAVSGREVALPQQNSVLDGHEHYPMLREQCHIIHGFKGLTWQDDDRPILDVLIAVLDGMGGRLFMELREKAGLAYAVSPVLFYGVAGGAFGVYAACAPEKVSTVRAVIRAELRFDKPISVKELERAKNYIIGNHQLEMASSDKHTMHLALMQLFRVGYDMRSYRQRLEALSLQDLERVIVRLISSQPSSMVCVGADLHS